MGDHVHLGAIAWQAWETRKAATAALLSTRAVINSERPWVIVDIPELPPEVFLVSGTPHAHLYIQSPLRIRFTNRGKSVCRITETSLRFFDAGTDGGSHLPTNPPCGKFITHGGLVLAPNIPWTVDVAMEKTEANGNQAPPQLDRNPSALCSWVRYLRVRGHGKARHPFWLGMGCYGFQQGRKAYLGQRIYTLGSTRVQLRRLATASQTKLGHYPDLSVWDTGSTPVGLRSS